ncbi:MAG: hypothetical protein O3B24_02350 [Verrucomicrobia bacterium]|nr:hypothetical protein [Verrucomicrobiota bacterium]
MDTIDHHRWRGAFWGVGLVAAVALNVVSLLHGDLNQDEGWYLYGARLVAEGQRPYVDFGSTQGPVMSYVYALATPLVRQWGVAGGRAFTSALGLIGVLLAAWLAARLTRREPSADGAAAAGNAAIATFFLVGVNIFQSYFTTIVKTYALAALWLVLAFLLLSTLRGRTGRVAAAAAGVCMSLAAATRISAVVVAGVTALALLCFARDIERRAALARAAWFIAGGVISALAVFLPFALAAPESFWFFMVQYHAGREVTGLVPWLAYKVGFLLRMGQAYATAVGLALALLLAWCFGSRDFRRPEWLTVALWGSVAGVSLLHLLAPIPYDDYQAMIYPLFAVGLAVALARRCVVAWPVAAVCAVCLVSVGSLNMAQSWFITRDRIWWSLKPTSPLAVLQDTARRIRALPGVTPGAEILTQDPYLAVEANLTLPGGMELGQFCYFPDLPAERARACHVLNAEQMREVLKASTAPVAAFSGYGFAMRSPEVARVPEADARALWDIVESRFDDVTAVEPFGQADTRLRILMRKPDA